MLWRSMRSTDAGRDYSPAELLECIKQNGFNVTFTGGDPMYQAKALIPLAGEIKRLGYNLWCYTGFTFEQLLRMTEPMELLQYIDVLVDGPYMEALRDTELRFRGSSNQRIIDVQHSLAAHIVVSTMSSTTIMLRPDTSSCRPITSLIVPVEPMPA